MFTLACAPEWSGWCYICREVRLRSSKSYSKGLWDILHHARSVNMGAMTKEGEAI